MRLEMGAKNSHIIIGDASNRPTELKKEVARQAMPDRQTTVPQKSCVSSV